MLNNLFIQYLENTKIFRIDSREGDATYASCCDPMLDIIRKIYKLKSIYLNEVTICANKDSPMIYIKNEEDVPSLNKLEHEEEFKIGRSTKLLSSHDTGTGGFAPKKEKGFDFIIYQNFGKFLLNVLTEIIDINISLDIEGIENLQKKSENAVKQKQKIEMLCYPRLKKYSTHISKLDPNIRTFFNWKINDWECILFNTNQESKHVCRICNLSFRLQDFIMHLPHCKKKQVYMAELSRLKSNLSLSIKKLIDHTKQDNILNENSKCSKEFFKQINQFDRTIFKKTNDNKEYLVTFLSQIIKMENQKKVSDYITSPNNFLVLLHTINFYADLIIKNKTVDKGKYTYSESLDIILNDIVICLIRKEILLQEIMIGEKKQEQFKTCIINKSSYLSPLVRSSKRLLTFTNDENHDDKIILKTLEIRKKTGGNLRANGKNLTSNLGFLNKSDWLFKSSSNANSGGVSGSIQTSKVHKRKPKKHMSNTQLLKPSATGILTKLIRMQSDQQNFKLSLKNTDELTLDKDGVENNSRNSRGSDDLQKESYITKNNFIFNSSKSEINTLSPEIIHIDTNNESSKSNKKIVLDKLGIGIPSSRCHTIQFLPNINKKFELEESTLDSNNNLVEIPLKNNIQILNEHSDSNPYSYEHFNTDQNNKFSEILGNKKSSTNIPLISNSPIRSCLSFNSIRQDTPDKWLDSKKSGTSIGGIQNSDHDYDLNDEIKMGKINLTPIMKKESSVSVKKRSLFDKNTQSPFINHKKKTDKSEPFIHLALSDVYDSNSDNEADDDNHYKSNSILCKDDKSEKDDYYKKKLDTDNPYDDDLPENIEENNYEDNDSANVESQDENVDDQSFSDAESYASQNSDLAPLLEVYCNDMKTSYFKSEIYLSKEESSQFIDINHYQNLQKKEILEETDKTEDETEIKTKITDFKFLMNLSKGGYGRVDLYRKNNTKDLHAIKTVNILYMKEIGQESLLQNETSILNTINHECLVKCYYVFSDETNFYFVFEFVVGGTLDQLTNKFNLNNEIIKLLIAEISMALDYLHSNKIIHRDIKPENIMISDEVIKI